MSTNAMIGFATEGGAEGRYHHWDGYPTGLGITLHRLGNLRYNRSVPKMRRELFIEHPAGWSTINNADWDFEPGFTDIFPDDRPCVKCGKENWQHYRQYYRSHDAIPPAGDDVLVLGHSADNAEYPEDHRPRCFCHGSRSEGAHLMLCVDATPGSRYCDPSRGSCQPGGIEWVYRIETSGIEVWTSVATEGGGAHRRIGFVGWWDTEGVMADLEQIGSEIANDEYRKAVGS